jgi:hypothetical protein
MNPEDLRWKDRFGDKVGPRFKWEKAADYDQCRK